MGAMKDAMAPAWMWALWAQAGWKTRWRHDTIGWGQRAAVKACGACPSRRTLPAWRRMWAKADKGRCMTASEWSAKTGEPIPEWLRE